MTILNKIIIRLAAYVDALNTLD